MANLRFIQLSDILRLYHKHLQLDAERFDLRQGLWRSCDFDKIREAISETYSLASGQEFKYPTLFDKASVLTRRLYHSSAFDHDCYEVSIEIGIQLIESSGYFFQRLPASPDDVSLAAYFQRCSTEK